MGGGSYSSGTNDNLFTADNISEKNNVAYGMNFEQESDDFTMKAGIVAVKEQTSMVLPITLETDGKNSWEKKTTYDVQREIALKSGTSYQASALLRYKQFTLAGGIIDNASVSLPSAEEEAIIVNKYGLHLGDSGKTWNVGGKYSFGCINLGAAHNKATRRVTGYEKSSAAVTSFTAELNITPGLTLFAEVNHIDAQTSESVAALYQDNCAKNNGTAFMIGSKMSF
jgi:predicted porin